MIIPQLNRENPTAIMKGTTSFVQVRRGNRMVWAINKGKLTVSEYGVYIIDRDGLLYTQDNWALMLEAYGDDLNKEAIGVAVIAPNNLCFGIAKFDYWDDTEDDEVNFSYNGVNDTPFKTYDNPVHNGNLLFGRQTAKDSDSFQNFGLFQHPEYRTTLGRLPAQAELDLIKKIDSESPYDWNKVNELLQLIGGYPLTAPARNSNNISVDSRVIWTEDAAQEYDGEELMTGNYPIANIFTAFGSDGGTLAFTYDGITVSRRYFPRPFLPVYFNSSAEGDDPDVAEFKDFISATKPKFTKVFDGGYWEDLAHQNNIVGGFYRYLPINGQPYPKVYTSDRYVKDGSTWRKPVRTWTVAEQSFIGNSSVSYRGYRIIPASQTIEGANKFVGIYDKNTGYYISNNKALSEEGLYFMVRNKRTYNAAETEKLSEYSGQSKTWVIEYLAEEDVTNYVQVTWYKFVTWNNARSYGVITVTDGGTNTSYDFTFDAQGNPVFDRATLGEDVPYDDLTAAINKAISDGVQTDAMMDQGSYGSEAYLYNSAGQGWNIVSTAKARIRPFFDIPNVFNVEETETPPEVDDSSDDDDTPYGGTPEPGDILGHPVYYATTILYGDEHRRIETFDSLDSEYRSYVNIHALRSHDATDLIANGDTGVGPMLSVYYHLDGEGKVVFDLSTIKEWRYEDIYPNTHVDIPYSQFYSTYYTAHHSPFPFDTFAEITDICRNSLDSGVNHGHGGSGYIYKEDLPWSGYSEGHSEDVHHG